MGSLDACGGDSKESNSDCEKSPQATISGKRKEEENIPVKSSLGLPMADASDAWMDDVGEGGFSESDDEEINNGTHLPEMPIEEENEHDNVKVKCEERISDSDEENKMDSHVTICD